MDCTKLSGGASLADLAPLYQSLANQDLIFLVTTRHFSGECFSGYLAVKVVIAGVCIYIYILSSSFPDFFS